MNRVVLKHIPVRPRNPFAGWQHRLHAGLLALFVVALSLVWLRLWRPIPFFGEARWPDGLLLVLTAAATLASLSRHLPAQNVVLAASVIGGIAGAAETLGAVTAIPFGPFTYNSEKIGQFLFYPLPWAVPVIWVVMILNARGVARLMLRPQRHRTDYGLWVIGLTTVLVVLFEFNFEPYATLEKQYWSWKPTKIPSDWYGTPWTNFLGSAVTALLILVFATPALINKSPVKSPPAWSPLLFWVLLSSLFLSSAALRRLWLAAGLNAAQMILVGIGSILAIRLESRDRSRRGTRPPEMRNQ